VLETSNGMSFWLALPLSLLFAAALGAAMERLFARPVLHAPVFTKAIATLALALVLTTIAQAIWPQLAQTEHFPTPFEGAAFSVGGVFITASALTALGVTVTVVAALTLFLNRTRMGMAMRASADNQPVAQLMGAPVGRIFLLTWALASVIGALAAIMLAAQQRTIDISYMNPVLILAFVAAVLGGLDSLPGALIGGVVVGLVENWLALLLAGHQIGALDIGAPGIRETLIFAAFVVVLLFRPQGLLGKAELRSV
jgi:branched-chain amino acid transport system permease protein